MAGEIIERLGATAPARPGPDYFLIRLPHPEILHTSDAGVFVQWNLPVEHSWPCSPEHMDGFVEKAAQALWRRFGARHPQSVLIGALVPHMLRLAGELADGTITGATGPHGLAEHVVPAITRAAADAGRPPPRVVAAVVACITDESDAARGRIAATSKAYATFPAFKAMLEREGVASQVDIGLIGSESVARAQAQRFVDAGATDLAVRESTATPEEAERTRRAVDVRAAAVETAFQRRVGDVQADERRDRTRRDIDLDGDLRRGRGRGRIEGPARTQRSGTTYSYDDLCV